MTENQTMNDLKINTNTILRTESKFIILIYYLTLVSESKQF